MRILRMIRGRRLRNSRAKRKSRPVAKVLLLLAGACFAAFYWILIQPLPLALPDLTARIRPQGARFYDRTGQLIVESGSARMSESIWYELESASPDDCVLSAFLSERGLAPAENLSPGLLDGPRAAANSLLGVKDLAGEGAAELMEMLGRRGDPWEAMRVAGALAVRYGRLSLAEWILNVRLYGNATVGVDDAARTYFAVPAGSLSLAQCAALEALAGNPDLANESEGWKNARNAILHRMLNGGFIEKKEWEHAIAGQIQPVGFDPNASHSSTDPYFGGRLPILDSFLELAVDRLGDRFGREQLPRSGIRVYTTLDLDFEMQVLCAAQNLLAPPDESSEALPTLEGKSCDLAALLGPEPENALPADFALAVMDPAGGEVLAYFDSARGEESIARGPAGTALLPFVYLSAFTRGFSPASMLLDIPRAGMIENSDGDYLGPITARSALQRRTLAATAGMVARVGEDQIAHTLSLLGLAGDGESALALEDQLNRSVDLLSMTQAYATLAGSGLETADRDTGNAAVIWRVEQMDGTALEEYSDRRPRRIFGSDLAYLVQDILTDPSGRTDLAAPALAGSRSTVAAVLAEDPDADSAWAFSFTPSFVIGVRSQGYAPARADPRTPWTLAQAAAGWVLRSLPVQTWPEPPGITRLDVCVPTGQLPSRYCPNVVSEIFLSGSEPSQIDSSYRPVAINRESGRLATLWTPLGQVEEQVFFTLEGEALSWAERYGFPLPPDAYDTLPDSFPYFPDLHLSSPAPLAILRGKIVFRGTAAVSGMDHYLVQAGPGLFPSMWYTLGSGDDPVREGNLATWDSTGAEGIWSIQLMGVYTNGKILTAAVPITVDNTPPVIHWILPAAPQNMSVLDGEALILQVQVFDNLEVEAVEFYLDGKLRTRLESGPYSVRWNGLAAGVHTAKICASDRSGNETCTLELEIEQG